MAWDERVNSVIEMISPEGDIYLPKWIGNDRSFSKKIGQFTFPGVDGTEVQDLGITGIKYPLTVYFDGHDHDIIAEDFSESLKQNGLWQVQHPTKGSLQLQLLNSSEGIQPVTNGNQTPFQLEFLEPNESQIIESLQNLKSQVLTASDLTNESGLEQFANKVSIATANGVTAIKNTVSKVTTAANNILGPLAQINGAVNSTFNAIQNGIDEILSATVLDTLALAGQIKALIQTPALVTTSFQSKFERYNELVTELFTIDTTDKDGAGQNTFSIKELSVVSAMVVIGTISVDANFKTQTESITSIDNMTTMLNSIVSNMDIDQEKFLASKIENQYISFSKTYSALVNNIYFANGYLLKASFDLAIERKFILKKPRTPMDIVVSEYGTDEKLDFFIDTNKLKNTEIMLLRAGREVVVFLERK
jgi:prophage DNA circulation protein